MQRRRDALKRGGRSRQVEKLTRVHGPELVGLFRQPTRLKVCLKAVALRFGRIASAALALRRRFSTC